MSLRAQAERAGTGSLIEPRCMDMSAIPEVFSQIDLLWSEGAAYNIGFANALRTWAPAMKAGGLAVVSELSWLEASAPSAVRDFFAAGYPGMQSVDENVAAAESAGYKILATHTLPRQAWVDRYYDVLEPRAKGLVHHADASVRDFAL